MLEKRTQQSLLEMEKIDALEELKELNERQAAPDFEGMLSTNKQQQEETVEQRLRREEEEDQAIIDEMMKQKGVEKRNGITIKRLPDIDYEQEEEERRKRLHTMAMEFERREAISAQKRMSRINEMKKLVKVGKTGNTPPPGSSNACVAGTSKPVASGLKLLQAYSDSEKEDSS